MIKPCRAELQNEPNNPVGEGLVPVYFDLIKKFVCNAKFLPLRSRGRRLSGGGLAPRLRGTRPLRRASLATSPVSRGGQKPNATSCELEYVKHKVRSYEFRGAV